MLQIQAQFVVDTGTVCRRYKRSLVALHPMLLSSLRVRHPIRLRPPSNQIPSAAQSDSVRHPIRFRPPPVGGYGILPYPRSPPRSPLRDPPCCPHRGCSGLRCTNQATNQATNQPPTNHPTNKPNHPTTKPFNFTHQKQPYIQQKH